MTTLDEAYLKNFEEMVSVVKSDLDDKPLADSSMAISKIEVDFFANKYPLLKDA